MTNEFQKAEFRPLPHGDFETDCLVCGETVMHQQGDVMEMYVGANPDGTTEVFGVFCAMCAKKRETLWILSFSGRRVKERHNDETEDRTA